MEGNPKFDASQNIPDFAYSKFGEMLGFKGIFVNSPDRLASAWQEARSSDRPVVLEVKTDPDVVPLPPHVTLKQAQRWQKATTQPAVLSLIRQNRSPVASSAKTIEALWLSMAAFNQARLALDARERHLWAAITE